MGIRWRGFEHKELYEMINNGPGADASTPQTTYWKDLTDELTDVDTSLNKKLGDLNATWEGKAAENAQSGLTPLAAWASDAQTGSTVMQSSTELQGDYIADARSQMPPPVAVTTPEPSTWDKMKAGAASVVGVDGPAEAVANQTADHEAQEAAQSGAQQQAVETMETYDSNSTWNRSTLGTFQPPPDVVVATPPPQGGNMGYVIGGTPTAKNVSGNEIPQSTTPNSYVPTGGGNPIPTAPTNNPTLPTGHLPPSTSTVPPPGTTTPSGSPPPYTNNPTLPPYNQGGGGNPPYRPGLPTGTPPGGSPPYENGNGPNSRGPLGGKPSLSGNTPEEAMRRGGLPRGGVPGGGSGAGGGLGGAAEGSRPGSQLGRGFGGMSGQGGGVRGPGAAGAAGGRGAGGPMGAGGRRGEGDDDDEHFTPDYLMETDDVFGDERRVAPTVIGDTTPKE